MKLDFLGKELNVGDHVVFMQKNYRNFLKGEIISMSEKKATIKHDKTNTCSTETIQFFGQLIKIN